MKEFDECLQTEIRCVCTDAVNVTQVSVPGSQTQVCAFQSSVHWLLSGQMLESQGLAISQPSSTWIFNACCMLMLAVLVAVSPILTPCDTFAQSQSFIHETIFFRVMHQIHQNCGFSYFVFLNKFCSFELSIHQNPNIRIISLMLTWKYADKLHHQLSMLSDFLQ